MWDESCPSFSGSFAFGPDTSLCLFGVRVGSLSLDWLCSTGIATLCSARVWPRVSGSLSSFSTCLISSLVPLLHLILSKKVVLLNQNSVGICTLLVSSGPYFSLYLSLSSSYISLHFVEIHFLLLISIPSLALNLDLWSNIIVYIIYSSYVCQYPYFYSFQMFQDLLNIIFYTIWYCWSTNRLIFAVYNIEDFPLSHFSNSTNIFLFTVFENQKLTLDSSFLIVLILPKFVDFSCYLYITMYLDIILDKIDRSRFKCFLKKL
jgi:hypothetical protein